MLQIPTVKSPLGIIALFVALIEVFLTYPVTQLEGIERTILVIFMTTFPFFIAMAFFYILWEKPITLYSPREIPMGMRNLYQPQAIKVASELKISEMEEHIPTLQSRLTALVTPSYNSLSTLSVSEQKKVTENASQSDLNSIE